VLSLRLPIDRGVVASNDDTLDTGAADLYPAVDGTGGVTEVGVVVSAFRLTPLLVFDGSNDAAGGVTAGAATAFGVC